VHAAGALADRGHRVSLDRFDDLIAHLATVHPAKYIKLIDGLEIIALKGVHELHDQNAALRLVAFIDRVYDAEVPIVASGVPLDRVFDAEMMAGGFRKKYLRSMSRMIALTTGELPPHD
jgi:cell division protein ZapE